MKARRHGIEAVSLDAEQKLPEVPDPNEKRIKELERELVELKRVMPAPDLVFANGNKRLEVILQPPITISPEQLKKERQEIRQKYRKYANELEAEAPVTEMPKLRNLIESLHRPSKERIEKYDAAIEEYYKKHDLWLKTKSEAQNWKRRLITLELTLQNTGTAPAEDIDLFLHFPDGFELFSADKYPRMPKEPAPPERPRGGFADLLPMMEELRIGSPTFQIADIGPRNVSGPQIRRTNSYEVNIHVRQLKHNLIQPLEKLYALFDSYEKAGSFGIDFVLVAANLPNPVTGTLHVIVRKSGTGG